MSRWDKGSTLSLYFSTPGKALLPDAQQQSQWSFQASEETSGFFASAGMAWELQKTYTDHSPEEVFRSSERDLSAT
jgi:hypothetical protein